MEHMDKKQNKGNVAKEGDVVSKEEFCDLIRKYEKSMYSVAYSVVRNEQDACDVVSEAILHVYYNLNTLKNLNAFKTWLLKVVHNTAVDYIRSNKGMLDIDEVEEVVNDEGPLDMETKLVLRHVINQLKVSYREVIVLYYYEELSTMEIAKVLGISVLTVRQRLSRARNELKVRLDKEGIVNEFI